MKPIITSTISTSAINGSISDSDQTAADKTRQRREAERMRQQRQKNDRQHHAEAESRLAEAMARASARSAQSTRLPRSLLESANFLPGSTIPTTDARDARDAFAIVSEQSNVEADQVNMAVCDVHETTDMPMDAAKSLLQRLARGDSRGLLDDCGPLLQALSAQMAGELWDVSKGLRADRESLACAFDFLQAYAETASVRSASAEKLARQLAEVRQQFDALPLGDASTVSIAAGVEQALASQIQVSGQGLRLTREHQQVKAARRGRASGHREVADDMDGLSPAAMVASTASTAAESAKMSVVSESSLDKDQRKRRDDTLPLVTLRSI